MAVVLHRRLPPELLALFRADDVHLRRGGKKQYPAVKRAGIQLVQRGLAKIDAHLAGRETFVGGAKTAVDAYAVPMLRWARNIDGVDFAAYTNAARFYGMITEDDGVVAAMQHQGIAP